MNIKNAERVVLWAQPKKPENNLNSMTDAFISLKPGMVLVYSVNQAGSTPVSILADASRIATRLGGSLVQWPNEKAAVTGRSWCFGIEKPVASV